MVKKRLPADNSVWCSGWKGEMGWEDTLARQGRLWDGASAWVIKGTKGIPRSARRLKVVKLTNQPTGLCLLCNPFWRELYVQYMVKDGLLGRLGGSRAGERTRGQA